ncbi:hypothetical protein FOWG_17842 [Fusarium oxysporum f. sp. lycopersici MN25]|nr:hypothetical protein FOWG_17842 [Fusarium oxysporum f. sp. lycopersici MN25]
MTPMPRQYSGSAAWRGLGNRPSRVPLLEDGTSVANLVLVSSSREERLIGVDSISSCLLWLANWPRDFRTLRP